ncbi:MAG TPA: triose-phosphate isomerase [Bacteroidia bacterium]|jgi:triosephosphate isomerase|nr:triose-phosphate isomerase [Bacteroidia bacterium]
MRKKIVAGNWKMNKNLHESILLADDIRIALEGLDKAKLPVILLSPPFPFLYPVSQTLSGTPYIAVAAQNCSSERSGAFTGEVSADMIRSTGARYTIIGHSERRSLFGETDSLLHRKLVTALESDLIPVFCVGEKLEERKAGKHFEVVQNQLATGLFSIPEQQLRKVVLAYEPVWAIGTGMTATAAQAQEMHAHIRKLLETSFGKEISEIIPILYGGSCNPSNAAELFRAPDVDGGLIGGASLKAADFLSIIKAAM